MIRIVESLPRKMTGKSSFLINFDFNQAIVDSLKGLPTYYYHKKDYTWEIPINCRFNRGVTEPNAVQSLDNFCLQLVVFCVISISRDCNLGYLNGFSELCIAIQNLVYLMRIVYGIHKLLFCFCTLECMILHSHSVNS